MKQLVLIAAASVSLLGSQLTGEVARPNVLFLAVEGLGQLPWRIRGHGSNAEH